MSFSKNGGASSSKDSASARRKETLFFGTAPPPEKLDELSFETPKPEKANKVPLGQFESQFNPLPMPLVWLAEECPDFKAMIRRQSSTVRKDSDLIDKSLAKTSKSFDSWINAAKARKEFHPLILIKIIAKIESLQQMSLKKKSKIKNIPDVIYWYDRLLPLLKEDGNANYGIPISAFAMSLKGRLLYYEPPDDDVPNNDLNNVELEEVLVLKKQLVVATPTDEHHLSIARTFNQLGRWAESITYSKRGLRLCASGDVHTALSLYGRLIEAQVNDKCYEEAMKTFKKLKKFNLNSMNAQDVNVKTAISDARRIVNLIKTHGSSYLMEHADNFDEEKKAIKIVTLLGNLCQWKSEIFQAFGNQTEHYNWLKVACSLYNFPFEEENADFLVCNMQISGNLIERIIHGACMIYVYEKRLERGSTLEERMSPSKNLLARICPFIGKMNGHVDYSPFFAKSVKRFSISTENFLPFCDAMIFLLNLGNDEETIKNLITYKNSMLINRHFMSRFCTEDE